MRDDRAMICIEVDGEVLPAALSGHPALEFTNTWAGWNSPPGAGGDYLTSYDVLLTLVTHHGLLTEDQAAATRAVEAVHACPGNDCGWLFLDPRNRRRWCSMAVCGNRAKARAHARRGDRA